MGLFGHLVRPLTPKSGAEVIVFLGHDKWFPRNVVLVVRVDHLRFDGEGLRYRSTSVRQGMYFPKMLSNEAWLDRP